jgi:hypothetical protein
MVRKLTLSMAMLAIAGVGSAQVAYSSHNPYRHSGHATYGHIGYANSQCGNDKGKDKNKGGTTSAPEIDPASAISALTLLAGGLAVIRGRRRKG